jgi:putative ABC transport system ATP-binding protein
MVTHELDIAAYCKRIIVMRDGRILSDTRNDKPQVAHEQILALNAAEQTAQLD